MLWKFCGKAQFPHSFGRFARNYAENRAFPQNFLTMKLGEITVFYAVKIFQVSFQVSCKIDIFKVESSFISSTFSKIKKNLKQCNLGKTNRIMAFSVEYEMFPGKAPLRMFFWLLLLGLIISLKILGKLFKWQALFFWE